MKITARKATSPKCFPQLSPCQSPRSRSTTGVSGRKRLKERTAGVEAQDAQFSGIGAAQPFDALDARGLARAVRADQAENLALIDFKRDRVDGNRRPVCLTQILDFNNRWTWHFDGCR